MLRLLAGVSFCVLQLGPSLATQADSSEKARVVIDLKHADDEPALFTVCLPDDKSSLERDFKREFDLPLDLSLHLAALPRGYEDAKEIPGLARVPAIGDLNDKALKALVSHVEGAYDRTGTWKRVGERLEDVDGKAFFALQDQAHNYQLVRNALRPSAELEAYVTEQVTALKTHPELRWDQGKAKLRIRFYEADCGGITVRLATADLTWRLTVPVSIGKTTTKGDVIEVVAEAPQLKSFAPLQPAGGNAASQPPTNSTTGTGAGASPPSGQPAGSAGGSLPSGANKAAAGGTQPGPEKWGASFAAQAFGVDLAALAKAGFDVVGGFAVPDNGPEPMVGIVGSFGKPKDGEKAPPWDSWKRFGLLGGRTTGEHGHWVVAPTYRVGRKAHLFGGGAFADSGGNTRDTFAFGIVYSLGDVIGSVTGSEKPKEPAAPDKVEVVIAERALDPYHAPGAASQRATIVVHTRDNKLDKAKTTVFGLENGAYWGKTPTDLHPDWTVWFEAAGRTVTGVECQKDGTIYSTAVDTDVNFVLEAVLDDGTPLNAGSPRDLKVGQVCRILVTSTDRRPQKQPADGPAGGGGGGGTEADTASPSQPSTPPDTAAPGATGAPSATPGTTDPKESWLVFGRLRLPEGQTVGGVVFELLEIQGADDSIKTLRPVDCRLGSDADGIFWVRVPTRKPHRLRATAGDPTLLKAVDLSPGDNDIVVFDFAKG